MIEALRFWIEGEAFPIPTPRVDHALRYSGRLENLYGDSRATGQDQMDGSWCVQKRGFLKPVTKTLMVFGGEILWRRIIDKDKQDWNNEILMECFTFSLWSVRVPKLAIEMDPVVS